MDSLQAGGALSRRTCYTDQIPTHTPGAYVFIMKGAGGLGARAGSLWACPPLRVFILSKDTAPDARLTVYVQKNRVYVPRGLSLAVGTEHETARGPRKFCNHA